MATQSLQASARLRANIVGDATASNPLGGTNRLANLLRQIEKKLTEKYAFDVFAENAINFGILVTYRQQWEPHRYQVGDLVKTIPLAPKGVVRYTTRTVKKKMRAQKELDDNLQTRRTEAADTVRAEEEIVNKAIQKTNFNLTASETFGGEGIDISSTQSGGGSTENQSAKTKKDFRESVLKSAQEFRQQHKVEVEFTESTETEETAFHEIQNPNDELAVTYLLYELERTYYISEKLYQLTPVIMVANKVPAPNEIDDAWLIEHDWILNRVILDDSFKPAIEYLTKSFVGAEVNIKILEANATAHKELVDKLNQQIRLQMGILAANQRSVDAAVGGLVQSKQTEGALNFVKRIFDPIGITGGANTGETDAAQAMVDYAKETLDRATRERARLLAEFEVAATALQAAVDKLSNAVKEHYDRVAEIDRLRVHVKENVLYYMQAIWRNEPPDQRYFRLYDLDVPIVNAVQTAQGGTLVVNPNGALKALDEIRAALGKNPYVATLSKPKLEVKKRKLAEIADLDQVLAYKGNYMVFGLKENNYITLEMMQDYIEAGDELLIRDPDESGEYGIDAVRELATKVQRDDPEKFAALKDSFRQLLIDRLTASRKEKELVIVPTSSLYVECLVGTHPLLEDFKLIHRALDVKKVQAEVRHAELENIRLAARNLRGKDEDPDIEKKVVIEGGAAAVIASD